MGTVYFGACLLLASRLLALDERYARGSASHGDMPRSGTYLPARGRDLAGPESRDVNPTVARMRPLLLPAQRSRRKWAAIFGRMEAPRSDTAVNILDGRPNTCRLVVAQPE